jgi:hypothetical protein
VPYTVELVADRYSFSDVTVTPQQFTLRQIDESGREFDRFEIRKASSPALKGERITPPFTFPMPDGTFLRPLPTAMELSAPAYCCELLSTIIRLDLSAEIDAESGHGAALMLGHEVVHRLNLAELLLQGLRDPSHRTGDEQGARGGLRMVSRPQSEL